MSNCVTIAARDFVELIRFPERAVAISLAQWDSLLRVAKHTNLIGRLAEGVICKGIHQNLPPKVRTHLDSAYVLTTHQREAIGWELRHISKALKNVDTDIVVLKGAAYVLRGSSAAQGRLFGDVDVLVARTALNNTEAALMVHGWTAGQHDPYDQKFYRQWMHEIPPMTNRARGTVIDVHHNILPTIARNCPNVDLLLAASQPVPNTTFRTFCATDMVIHSATHLFHESELQNGLRDLFDLDSLLTEFSVASTDFWIELADRAALLRLELPVYLALRLTKAIIGTSVPGQVLAKLESSMQPVSRRIKALEAIYLRALMPDHPGCGNHWSTTLARGAVFLRGHFLRMPPTLLSWHLSRKLVIRLFRNTSRST